MITALPLNLASPHLASPAHDVSTPPFRNFLIIAPAALDVAEGFDSGQALVAALAHHLIEDGYVYVLTPGQQQLEDDNLGIRYLPLRERLPSFGMLTAVIVIGNSPWVTRAADTYPDAEMFILNSVSVPHASKATVSARTSI